MGRRGYPPCNSWAMGIQWYLELATVSWECCTVFYLVFTIVYGSEHLCPWRITAVYKSNCWRISRELGCRTHPRLLSCYYRCFPNMDFLKWKIWQFSFSFLVLLGNLLLNSVAFCSFFIIQKGWLKNYCGSHYKITAFALFLMFWIFRKRKTSSVSAKRAHFNFHFPLGVECSSWGTPSYLLNRLCWRPPPTPPAPALFKHGPQTLPLAYLIFAPLLELLLKNGCKNISAGVTEFKKKYFSTISFYILECYSQWLPVTRVALEMRWNALRQLLTTQNQN